MSTSPYQLFSTSSPETEKDHAGRRVKRNAGANKQFRHDSCDGRCANSASSKPGVIPGSGDISYLRSVPLEFSPVITTQCTTSRGARRVRISCVKRSVLSALAKGCCQTSSCRALYLAISGKILFIDRCIRPKPRIVTETVKVNMTKVQKLEWISISGILRKIPSLSREIGF